MKRYLIIMFSFIIIVLTGHYLYYVEGLYINFDKKTVTSTVFSVDDEQFVHEVNGEKKEFVMRGIEVDSSYGPKRGTDFTIDEETWLRWFEEIQQMGANTIRISTIYDDRFYNAFYKYNKDRKNPLYLLQGIRVATDEFKTYRKKESLEFYETLLKDGKNVVDIIHGRKVLLANDHKGDGFYFHDISPWVIGFLVGDEWDQDMIAYINETLDKEPSFNGEYVYTTSEATNFEVMMAEVIERLVGYETRKYHSQRPISVNSTFLMDPFRYQEHYALQLEKLNTFNIDHIQPTAQMQSGLFASYAFETFDFPLQTMIDQEELTTFSAKDDYFQLLHEAHKMPIIISSIGYPSDRYINQTEKQEQLIVEDLKKFDSIGYNGIFIRSWQDVWDRRTLETSYAVDLQQINEWHDMLTSTQHFGLIGFKPYRDDVLMKVDGKKDDWEGDTYRYQDETTKILMTRDHTYLYFWIEDPAITKVEPFYIAFDLHPNIGSKSQDVVDLHFDKNMDFILKVDPFVGANMYVHERYQSVKQNFLELVSGRNPFFHDPKEKSPTFESMKYLNKDKKILTEEEMYVLKTKAYHYNFSDIEPLNIVNQQKEFDIVVENGTMEIRIPYALMNIYDPLKFTIHDDYYKNYGVEPLEIEQFYMSIGNKKYASPKSVKVQVEPLDHLERVKEYKKPSYFAIQNYWKGEN